MKTSLQAVLIAVAAVMLAACASGGGMASTKTAPESYQAPDQVVTDAVYVATVERVARRRGVTVRWFNPPVKHVDSVADAGTQ